MEVTVAKSAGFCFGVKRAVDTVYREIESGEKPVYTFGPIIHNEQVVEDLENRGVQVIHSEDELEGLSGGTVVIRSHGVSRDVCEKIEARGMKIVDATCPFVKKIHRIVDEEGRKGRHVVIIGSADHPEVQGIMGWASGPVTVMHTAEEAESFVPENGKPISIVAQTTFNYNKFKDLVEIFLKKSYDSTVLKTICNATEERQTEARAIARKVDAMFVVGGRHSSNTQKLYEICKEECKNTYFIETLVDLESKPFQSFGRVGITAGASTPNKIIEEVQKMSEMSFEQMLDESFKTIRNGEVVEGTVIDVKDDQIILNIGYKADGILTKNEYSNDSSIDLHTVAQPGDKMEVKVLKVNDGEGQVLLTYKRLAEVLVNGKRASICWAPPYAIDIQQLLHEGDNLIEIRVTNLWVNRLIGDEYLPEENVYNYQDIPNKYSTLRNGGIKKLPEWYLQGKPKPAGGRIAFTTWKHYDKTSPLVESGLLGPVTLTVGKIESLNI